MRLAPTATRIPNGCDVPFEVDTRDLTRLADKLDRMGRAGQTEINRALSDTRRRSLAEISRDIRREYTVKVAGLRPKLTASPVRKNSFTTTAARDALSLKHFGKINQTRKGVSVKIFKARPRTLLRSAFIVATRGDQVFARVRDRAGRRVGRLPIRRLTGPSAAQMFAKRDRIRRIENFVGERLRGDLTRRYRRLFRERRR